MRTLLVLFFACFASSASAATIFSCQGRHHLQVDWQAALLTVDGTTYQMHKDRTGKQSSTLRGHDITYIHVNEGSKQEHRGHNVLEMGGAREIYYCQQTEGDDSAARRTAVAYRPNTVIEDSSAADSAREGSNASSSGGKGKGGGHGRNK